jgi:hypothetical protein
MEEERNTHLQVNELQKCRQYQYKVDFPPATLGGGMRGSAAAATGRRLGATTQMEVFLRSVMFTHHFGLFLFAQKEKEFILFLL